MADTHTHEHIHEHTHEHTHDHVHTHADGTTHSHSHDGSGAHSHDGAGAHSHGIASSPEEALAMLRYMLSHNQHHAAELHDLGHCFEAEIADLVHDAVDRLSESNDLLEQALALIDNEVK